MYPDIDYIYEIRYYIRELSFNIKNKEFLNESVITDMLYLALELYELLNQYLIDKYY